MMVVIMACKASLRAASSAAVTIHEALASADVYDTVMIRDMQRGTGNAIE